ncbi:alpha/beta fold hydrolase [Yoonia litorea]|uniref:Serine aminopeptidase, S33 n=1 Tax=Yoonia litorea TaxID=1123755 RepID=A0A1I6LNJ0_9RHOB|nr:alpha/beta fold hydrolase [Yoonia litorea]SFS04979.1 Serine aminopeptidase, S33 [Yoonia litorea]
MIVRKLLAAFLVIVSLWALESTRSGVSVTWREVGATPVMAFEGQDASGPVIVIAHGFAGSAQMMQGYGFPLARAGYRVFVFDFLGHGRHTVPMSGDVTAVDGTTRLLVDQTHAVIDAVSADGRPVGLLGHSMASDVLVRVANERDDVGAMVLLSAFSQEITPQAPNDLLLLVGDWEPGLREFALEAAAMAASAQDLRRDTVVLPYIEHVSILQSRLGQTEALKWFEQTFARQSECGIGFMGPAIVGLLLGLVFASVSLAASLPLRAIPALDLSSRHVLLVLGLPMLATPVFAAGLETSFMPVLVADYLAVHLLIYGGLQLLVLALWRVAWGPFSWAGFGLLLLGCVVFGAALNRYAANYWPTGDRLWIIGIMSVGAVVFFLADARLSHGATRAKRILIRVAFLISLLIAVALNFSELFFLVMIAPVIVLFYLVFGTMGHAVSIRVGPLAPGVALGLMLAWSLGVTFPLFQS